MTSNCYRNFEIKYFSILNYNFDIFEGLAESLTKPQQNYIVFSFIVIFSQQFHMISINVNGL